MIDNHIDYRSHTNIKAQTIANFLVEIPDSIKNVPTILLIDLSKLEVSRDIWELHTDGVASKEVLGEGLILKNHNWDEITYALHFNFQISSNEANYEALIAGLQLYWEARAKHIVVLSDSLLIINQVNDAYDAKDQRMQRYSNIVRELV